MSDNINEEQSKLNQQQSTYYDSNDLSVAETNTSELLGITTCSDPVVSKSFKQDNSNKWERQSTGFHNSFGSTNVNNMNKPRVDFRLSSKRMHQTEGKGILKYRSGSVIEKTLQHQHNFHSDVTDVRQMEQGLLQLLDNFHSGKLQAFGEDFTFEKLKNVREQQETLARLHFDLNAQQERLKPLSQERRNMTKENLNKLVENLQHLSHSIEQLQFSENSEV